MIEDERKRRQDMWRKLSQRGGSKGADPQLLRELSIYGGQQGIWVDKKVTGALAQSGVTVSLMHRGHRYSDDLDEDTLLYHYPQTGRRTGRDQAEIDATKACKDLQLPLFVVAGNSSDPKTRDVFLGWVHDWDDDARQFLVILADEPPGDEPLDTIETPFELTKHTRPPRCEATARPGQPRFRFLVFKRYGARCAVCDIDVPALLDAAHICPKNAGGTDDPRNGLVLCANHHRAFDNGLFSIEPVSLRISFNTAGPTSSELGIERSDLTHLPFQPHNDAVQWRFKQLEEAT